MKCPKCGKDLPGCTYELQIEGDGVAAIPTCPYCGARLD